MPEKMKMRLPIPKGLRPEADMLYDLEYLNDCQNLYLNRNGVFEAEKFTKTAFGLADSVSAQVFVTTVGVYVITLQADATTDTLYEWNGTSLITKVSSIPSVYRNNLWSCADYGVYVLFTNGETTLVRDINTGTFSIDNTVISVSNWICSHRGRLILTGPTMDNKGIISEGLIAGYPVTSDLIRIHNGKTGVTISSFASPDDDVSGITVANGNLITCGYDTDKIFIHSLLTGDIDSSFNSPGALPYAVAFDGTNLISADATVGNQKIYIHNGITSGTSSNFPVPYAEVGVRGIYDICIIGGNLISCDTVTSGNAKIYIHNGITAEISSSFEVVGRLYIPGLTTDGTNIIYDAGSGEIRFCDGITSTVTKIISLDGGEATAGLAYVKPNYPVFIEWSKVNEQTFQNTTTTDISNLSGYMPMEYSEDLLRAEPLKQHIIIYGKNGVSALTLAGIRGYGMTTLHHTGIKDVGSVCLNGFADGSTAHYFIDTSGELYVIDASLTVTRIGYKEIFSAAHTANPGLIRMSYNIRRDEILINFYNSDTTYIYGKDGLTIINGDIETLIEKSGTRYVHAYTTIAQSNVVYQTNTIDMGAECQKYLWGIAARITCPEAVSVVVDYRTTRTGSWTSSPTMTFDKARGYLNVGRLAGVEFKIKITVASYTTFQMSDIEVVYSKIDGGDLDDE